MAVIWPCFAEKRLHASPTLFDGKTAADFTAINGENNAVVSFDDETDTASFAVHISVNGHCPWQKKAVAFEPPADHFYGACKL